MVFVLDRHKKPLMPCSEKRARQMLEKGKAVVHKLFPMTIRLKDRTVEQSQFQELRLKIDPGSKTTGLAVLRQAPQSAEAIWFGEVRHKPGIKKKLDKRRMLRRGRRNRKTRYRIKRFSHRTRKKGWLPPSLEARVNQTLNAVNKLRKILPITAISTEHVKFDTQLLQSPEISGADYQQGDLFGYEVREYLLEKWGRECAYCAKTDVPLEVEHVVPKNPAHGPKGTDRLSNLTVACRSCNKAKDNLQPDEWLEELLKSPKEIDRKRSENLPKVLKQLKEPLKDAAMLNATRWALFEKLKATGVPVECGTGARTKKQRLEKHLPKTHYYDAACVGESTPEKIGIHTQYVNIWSASGRGSRRIANVDKYGFPTGYRSRRKQHFGFQTGDIVKAEIPKGKYAGTWVGRVAVRNSGYFDIKNLSGTRVARGVSYKHLRILQRADGWGYEAETALPPKAKAV